MSNSLCSFIILSEHILDVLILKQCFIDLIRSVKSRQPHETDRNDQNFLDGVHKICFPQAV